MPLIPNFPQNLLDLHHHWHIPGADPGSPGRLRPFGTAGAGLEFLQFHRDYIAQFHAWYDTQPFGSAPFNVAPFQTAPSAQAAVAGWTSIPAALKNPAVTNWGGVQIGQEARLTSFTPAFASEDELGAYIEGGIHGWIHGAAAAAYEPIVGNFHSPQSTYFYGIHGLVQYWWTRWQNRGKRLLFEQKRILADKSLKEFIKDIKERKELIFEKSPFEKPIKEKDKDNFEGGFPGGGDPLPFASAGVANDAGMTAMAGSEPLLLDVQQRLSDLETRVSQQAFIVPTERPLVGEAAQQALKQPPAEQAPQKEDKK